MTKKRPKTSAAAAAENDEQVLDALHTKIAKFFYTVDQSAASMSDLLVTAMAKKSLKAIKTAIEDKAKELKQVVDALHDNINEFLHNAEQRHRSMPDLLVEAMNLAG